ncbi:MAG: type II toxin-antitoxin system VapC family toxin [Calditrichaeota bacterium]|nr:MAG: type II toxin-antitoxin system VapC family toxin [Calditrichota bacterium]MBL1204779.1 type II toxin-antitoxin system VapC family toxin [Calditrichota bacterium]NOG44608.1 type II toxin-antitoxin system VapC family toxin [Calditrichota bacterium]
MRKVLIDTNIYSAFKLNNKAVIESFQKFDLIGIDVTVMAELYSGFKLGSREKINREEFEEFLNIPRVRLFGHDDSTADFYGNIFTDLRANGKPIPTNDIWIAAVAKQQGLALYTLDKHFENISGLILI